MTLKQHVAVYFSSQDLNLHRRCVLIDESLTGDDNGVVLLIQYYYRYHFSLRMTEIW